MDNKPALDRSFLIPIFIGFISVVGICLVLFAARLGASRGTVQTSETATPLKYQYLATEPGIAVPTDAPPGTATLAEIPTLEIIDLPPTLFPTDVPTLVVVPNATKALVTTSPSPTALVLGVKYDDADFKFNYIGTWIGQSGVSDAYQNTLHVSNTIGDSVQLSFVGQKILFAYQAGPSLGSVAIKLDGVDFSFDQFAPETLASEWESPILSLSSHSVTITHIAGGSINLDSIAVIDLATPTPTIAPLITPTVTNSTNN